MVNKVVKLSLLEEMLRDDLWHNHLKGEGPALGDYTHYRKQHLSLGLH
jgi:hypothetical protein